jgi:Archaeal fructose-1,6-bisphosphatase and related enzymes of inositol monophosphatase family
VQSALRHPDITYLKKLAWRAGGIMKANFCLNMERQWKSDETPVTVTDTAINDLVLELLGKDFPDVRVIGEEGSNTIEDAEYTIFCDPVDGTIPFSLGVPVSTFCISVFEKGEPIIGLIYDPFQERMWFAERGQGAFLWQVPEFHHDPLYKEEWSDKKGDTTRIHVSACNTINRSNISMIWWKGSPYHLHDVCAELMDAGGHWINLASLAIFGGLIASGTIDSSIFPGKNAWETGAMEVIVEEAGGKVTDIFGNNMVYGPRGQIQGHIISNGLIHDELVKMVGRCNTAALVKEVMTRE